MPSGKPNVSDLSDELQTLKVEYKSTLCAIKQQLDILPTKEDLNTLKTGLATKNDIELIKQEINNVLNSKELEEKIDDKIKQCTAPIFEDMEKRLKKLENANKTFDLRQCETLLVISGIKVANDSPFNTLTQHLPSEFRDFNFRAKFIGKDERRKILVEFPNKYHKREFQKQLRSGKIGLTLGINATEFIPESFNTERKGLIKLGMELKKSKTIGHFEVINGGTDIFLGVNLTVNKKKVFSRTTGQSMVATVNSFKPPLDELINNTTIKAGRKERGNQDSN